MKDPTNQHRDAAPRSKVGRALALWLPAAACAALLLYLSVCPERAEAQGDQAAVPHLDKLLHAGAYGLLAWLLARAVGGTAKAGPGDVALIACIWASAYGGLIEILQGLTGRTPDVVDLLANVAGAALAAWAWRWVAVRRSRAPA